MLLAFRLIQSYWKRLSHNDVLVNISPWGLLCVKCIQRILKLFWGLLAENIPNTPFQYQIHNSNTKNTNPKPTIPFQYQVHLPNTNYTIPNAEYTLPNTRHSSILIYAVCRDTIFYMNVTFWGWVGLAKSLIWRSGLGE